MPRQHAKKSVCAFQYGSHARRIVAWLTLRDSLAGPRPRTPRCDCQLSGTVACVRSCFAEQLTRSAHAMAACHRAGRGACHEARRAGTVDTLSHGSGHDRSGDSAGGHRTLSRYNRCRRCDFGHLSPQHDLRQCQNGRAVSRQSERAGARAWFF